MTNNLELRIQQHRSKTIPGHTRNYNLSHLVYFETSFDVKAAIAREKQIKAWTKEKRLVLIESINPREF